MTFLFIFLAVAFFILALLQIFGVPVSQRAINIALSIGVAILFLEKTGWLH